MWFKLQQAELSTHKTASFTVNTFSLFLRSAYMNPLFTYFPIFQFQMSLLTFFNHFVRVKFCDSGSDDENEGQGFQIFYEEDELKLTDNLHPLIRKVRTAVKVITDKKRYSAETYQITIWQRTSTIDGR
jgi:hypothetical protein